MFLSVSHSPADQCGRQMEEALEIGHFLFVAHFQFAVVIHPRVSPFHHPAAGLSFCPMPLPGRALLGQVRDVASDSHLFVCWLSCIALIHTKVLRSAGRRVGPLDDDGVQRCSQQLHVMPIGSGDDKRERGATAVHQQTALGPFFSPGLSGYFQPPLEPAGLCPASHPDSATPKQSPPSRHTPPTRLATAAQRIPPAASVENAYGSRWHCQTLWATPSTDTPCATHTRWRR